MAEEPTKPATEAVLPEVKPEEGKKEEANPEAAPVKVPVQELSTKDLLKTLYADDEYWLWILPKRKVVVVLGIILVLAWGVWLWMRFRG